MQHWISKEDSEGKTKHKKILILTHQNRGFLSLTTVKREGLTSTVCEDKQLAVSYKTKTSPTT